MLKHLYNWLEKLLPPHAHHLIGDLQEEFEYLKENSGPGKAVRRLLYQIARSTPYFFIESLIWNAMMISNYLKVTARNVRKYKTFSFINVLGLAISMSVCLLIILFIIDQRSYDRFHSEGDRLYRVISELGSVDRAEGRQYASSPAALGDLLVNKYNGVSEAITMNNSFGGEALYNNKQLQIGGLYVEPAFFEIFDFEMVSGDPATALQEPFSLVISQEQATRFFGGEDPLGKVLTVLEDGDYTITGVIDASPRSHLNIQALASYSTLTSNEEYRTSSIDPWFNSMFYSYTYLLVDETSSPEQVNSLFPELIKNEFPVVRDRELKGLELQKVTAINLGPVMNNQIGMVMPALIVYFLGGLALIVIVIGSFNYVSLTIARSLSRGKEVGVRKVLGANRSHVFRQFMIEAVLIALVSLVAASVMLKWLVPQFNALFVISFTGNQILLDFLRNYFVYVVFIFFGILIGLTAGTYPALYLSAFNPSTVLKGLSSIKGFSASTLRKIITVGQFSFSIIFIVTSIIIYQQYNHLVGAEYGFDSDHVINLELQDVPFERARDMLVQNPNIQNVAGSSLIPALNSVQAYTAKTEDMDEEVELSGYSIDENYVEVMGLNLLAGRNFDRSLQSDIRGPVLINEQAVEILNLKDPANAVGAYIQYRDSSYYQVIGVIENFVSNSILDEIDAVILDLDPQRYIFANIRTEAGKTLDVAEYLTTQWGSLGSVHTVKFDIYNDQLESDPNLLFFGDFIKIISAIAGFSIFISCLGLLGMAMYSAETRVKEIGVRKVLGASTQDIAVLLSREYLVLIVISIVIATPLTWIINNLWLQELATRINLGPVVFVIGILGTILLAGFTISSQTLKAAKANSIDNLRSE